MEGNEWNVLASRGQSARKEGKKERRKGKTVRNRTGVVGDSRGTMTVTKKRGRRRRAKGGGGDTEKARKTWEGRGGGGGSCKERTPHTVVETSTLSHPVPGTIFEALNPPDNGVGASLKLLTYSRSDGLRAKYVNSGGDLLYSTF